ncbi:serine hydrolase [Demequina sp. NBRC 110053]|uniref:serine hydrolase domain-containing protein n=1 Tax=Demequina sp. NBRC 110053 TaxID=1570342 RepID=UPI0009FBBC8B|nr:serine hydrolase [Demequina sp. NBRC 110053]
MARARIPLTKLPRVWRQFMRPSVFTPDSLDEAVRAPARSDAHRSAAWEAEPDAELTQRLNALAASGALDRAHAVLVTRGGRVAAEHYGHGPDARYGERLRPIAYGPDQLHDVRSVTKTITGLLYGIAQDDGLVPPPEAHLADCLPAHRPLLEEAGSADLTVHHVLSMTMGTEWREEVPYTDARNGEIAMELARDRDAYILSRPRVEPAGRTWRYCGGASALLGTLIEAGTGVSLPRFAHERLLTPLGIEHWQWLAGGDGRASPASGLRLTAPDLARIGQVLLAADARAGSAVTPPVVPDTWLERATAVHASQTWAPGLAYGYQMYLGGSFAPEGEGPGWRGGIGNGGQYVMALPSLDAVAVVLTGAYDAAGAEQGAEARAVVRDVLAA